MGLSTATDSVLSQADVDGGHRAVARSVPAPRMHPAPRKCTLHSTLGTLYARPTHTHRHAPTPSPG